ncbi:RNA-directed DNA polymerase, eukaryota, partial [Tanacetum coccineum]
MRRRLHSGKEKPAGAEKSAGVDKLTGVDKSAGMDNVKESESREHPPGFTPSSTVNEPGFSSTAAANDLNINKEGVNKVMDNNEGHREGISSAHQSVHHADSNNSSRFKISEIPRSGGSILSLMDELVRVGQTMGYKMRGCENDISDIIETQGVSMVNVLALQETKMEHMELFCVKACWGNLAFDFVHSNSVGNSGGILCAWDPNSFQKSNHTISDFFVIVRGVWLKSGGNMMLVVVYAPHDPREKLMLWEYLTHVINNWNGEVILMGDFNEVRNKSERFGSVFHTQGAENFNSFIMNAGLDEVPLGGSAFTWCHKSASKMSKLDRFLVSENLWALYPNISAITLDRFLSDHRPILLRESSHDYGPCPFRFYHYWLEIDGFSKLVNDSWNEAPVDISN